MVSARAMILDLYEEFWLRTWGNIIYIIPAFYEETMQTLILYEACMGDTCLLRALPLPFHKFIGLPPQRRDSLHSNSMHFTILKQNKYALAYKNIQDVYLKS